MDLESQAAEETGRLERQIDMLKMEVESKDNELNKVRHEKERVEIYSTFIIIQCTLQCYCNTVLLIQYKIHNKLNSKKDRIHASYKVTYIRTTNMR